MNYTCHIIPYSNKTQAAPEINNKQAARSVTIKIWVSDTKRLCFD